MPLLRRTTRRVSKSVLALGAICVTWIAWLVGELVKSHLLEIVDRWATEHAVAANVARWCIDNMGLLAIAVPLTVMAVVMLQERAASPLQIVYEDREPFALRPHKSGLPSHRRIVVRNDSDKEAMKNVRVVMQVLEPAQAVPATDLKEMHGKKGPFDLSAGDELAFDVVSYDSLGKFFQDFQLHYDSGLWSYMGIGAYRIMIRVTAAGVADVRRYFRLGPPDPETGDLGFEPED